MNHSSRLMIRVPPDLPKAIEAAASAEGIGKSEFTRRALEQALAGRDIRVSSKATA